MLARIRISPGPRRLAVLSALVLALIAAAPAAGSDTAVDGAAVVPLQGDQVQSLDQTADVEWTFTTIDLDGIQWTVVLYPDHQWLGWTARTASGDTVGWSATHAGPEQLDWADEGDPGLAARAPTEVGDPLAPWLDFVGTGLNGVEWTR
ncbi:hypothetical protein BH20CHL6_BH20CHL6_02240 [soil metagenome]